MADRIATSPWRVSARFVGAAALLLLLWLQVESGYVASLVRPVDLLLGSARVALTHDGRAVVVGLETDTGWRAFRLAGDEVAYLGQVVALAVLLSIPGLTVRRRLAWCLAVAVLLWISHVGMLYAGTCSAIYEYQVVAPVGPEWTQTGRPWWLAADRAGELAILGGRWATWGCPTLIMVAAVLSMPRHLWRAR